MIIISKTFSIALRGLSCLAVGLFLAAGVWADTVEMTNGLKMEGKVQLETEDFIILLVYDETGRIRIPRSQIKGIEYDFDSKAEGLAEDDFKGHYDLGVWAFEKGMYKEAIAQFEKVKGKEGAGKDLLKLLGQSYDKRKQIDKAYENFKEYLKFNQQDTALKARADEIAKELGIGDAPVKTQAKDKPKIKDGLEAQFKWKSESPATGWKDANPCSVMRTADQDTGNKMIVIQTPGGKNEKVALSGVGANPLNLSNSNEILFKAYHDGSRPIDVAVAFTNKNGEFFESKPIRVPGSAWTKQSISLTGKNYKSKQTNWQYKTELGGKGHINSVYIMINTRKKFTMYIDHIFFK